MRVLLLAPHPFYQERGTPIAVDLLLSTLSERGNHIDILTFHEGQDRQYPNLTIHRINPKPRLKNIPTGFSFKKIYCDLVLFIKLIQLLNKQQYDLIHAVEESASMAYLCQLFTKTPYLYDMDSIISEQLMEKSTRFKVILPLVKFFESQTIKHARLVVAVCQSIADYAATHRDEGIYLLKDISLISDIAVSEKIDDLRQLAGTGKKIGLYIGNLEHYQGLDLVLKATQIYRENNTDLHIIIVGGNADKIKAYQSKAAQLEITDSITFLGSRPLSDMGAYMQQVDFLLSPRIKGTNTPMKVYSYLASGIPLLATDLPTHTQVMDETICYLTHPEPQAMADTIAQLIQNPQQAAKIGHQARDYAKQHHSIGAFKDKVNEIYTQLEASLI